MIIDNPMNLDLKILRGKDFNKTVSIGYDLSSYTLAKAQIRKENDPDSELIIELAVTVGSYSGGETPVTFSAGDVDTLAAAQGNYKWSFLLTLGGDDSVWVRGNADVYNDPTKKT